MITTRTTHVQFYGITAAVSIAELEPGMINVCNGGEEYGIAAVHFSATRKTATIDYRRADGSILSSNRKRRVSTLIPVKAHRIDGTDKWEIEYLEPATDATDESDTTDYLVTYDSNGTISTNIAIAESEGDVRAYYGDQLRTLETLESVSWLDESHAHRYPHVTIEHTDALETWMDAIYASGEQMGLEMWANYRDAIAS